MLALMSDRNNKKDLKKVLGNFLASSSKGEKLLLKLITKALNLQ
jgi:hypothetical protein